MLCNQMTGIFWSPSSSNPHLRSSFQHWGLQLVRENRKTIQGRLTIERPTHFQPQIHSLSCIHSLYGLGLGHNCGLTISFLSECNAWNNFMRNLNRGITTSRTTEGGSSSLHKRTNYSARWWVEEIQLLAKFEFH